MESITKIIAGKEVIFEPIEIVDKHGHSNEWLMEGTTEINKEWKLTHYANGSYTYTGEFEEINDIEEV